MSATQTVTQAELEKDPQNTEPQDLGAVSKARASHDQDRSVLTHQGREKQRKGKHSDKPASEVVVSAPALSTRSGAQQHKRQFLRQESIYPELPPDSESEAQRVDIATSMHSTLDPTDAEPIVTQSEEDWPRLQSKHESDKKADKRVNTTAKAYDLEVECPTAVVDQEYHKVFSAYERHVEALRRAATYMTNMLVNFSHRFLNPDEVREAQAVWDRLIAESKILFDLNNRRYILEQRNSCALTRADPPGQALHDFQERAAFLGSIADPDHLEQIQDMIQRHTPASLGPSEEMDRVNSEKTLTWKQDVLAFRTPTPTPGIVIEESQRRRLSIIPEGDISMHSNREDSPLSPPREVTQRREIVTSTPLRSEPTWSNTVEDQDTTAIYATPLVADSSLVNMQMLVTQPVDLARTTSVPPDPQPATFTGSNGVANRVNFTASQGLASPMAHPAFQKGNNPFYTPGVQRPKMATRLLVETNDPHWNPKKSTPPISQPSSFTPRFVGPQVVPNWGRNMGLNQQRQSSVPGSAAFRTMENPSPFTLPAEQPMTRAEEVSTAHQATTANVAHDWNVYSWVSDPRFRAYNIGQMRQRVAAQEHDDGQQNPQVTQHGQPAMQAGNPGGPGDGYPGGPGGPGGPGNGPPGRGFPGGGPPGGGPPGGGSSGPSSHHEGDPDSDSQSVSTVAAADAVLAANRRLQLLEQEIIRLRQERERDRQAPPSWLQDVMTFNTSHHHKKSKVAPLQLPQFKGDHVQWPEWWDLFHSLIHLDKNFTETEKVAYIYEKLPEGSDARSTVAGFRKMGTSYLPIINRLKVKYGQKSRLLASLIQSILYAPAADSAAAAQKLLDKFWGDTRSLQSYGVPLNDACTSIMLITVLQSKMPKKVSEQWEVQMTEDATRKAEDSKLDVSIPVGDACPPVTITYTVEQFLTFCEERVRAMLKSAELAHSNKVLTTPKQQQSQQKTPDAQAKPGNASGTATLSRNQQKKLNREKAAAQATPTAQALVTNQPTGASKNSQKKASQKAAKEAATPASQAPASGQGQKPKYQYFDSGCFMCGANHNPEACSLRTTMINTEKWARVRNRFNPGPYCQRCFSPEHKADVCPKGECGINGCTRRHNPILHTEKSTS
jgi:hypothetical protein